MPRETTLKPKVMSERTKLQADRAAQNGAFAVMRKPAGRETVITIHIRRVA